MLNMSLRRFLHVGQKLPSSKLTLVSASGQKYAIERDIDSSAFFSNKKVVIVGFPGAFTPTCTGNHIPEFIKLHSSFKSKGVEVVGLAVNDAFVMKEFAEALKGSISFICDGSGVLTKQIDAGLDLADKGLGFRTRRFTALVENGAFKVVNDENGGALTDISKAETILKQLN